MNRIQRILLASLILFLFGATGCSDWAGDDCEAGEMRCDGNTAQMCEPKGDGTEEWEDYLDCAYLGESCTQNCAYSGIACCI